MTKVIHLDNEEGYEIIWGDNEDYSSVTPEEITGQSRWAISKEQVFRRISDGTYWRLSWDVGATESQDDTEPEFSMIQVVPVSKMVTVYEVLKEAANDRT